MKALIWIGCMTLSSILQRTSMTIVLSIPTTDDSGAVLVGMLNGILAAASIGFCMWLAHRLCKLWDWNKVCEKAKQEGMTVSEYGRDGLSEEFLTKLENFCRASSEYDVKEKFKELVKKGKITKDQRIILYKEFME